MLFIQHHTFCVRKYRRKRKRGEGMKRYREGTMEKKDRGKRCRIIEREGKEEEGEVKRDV